MGPLGIVLAWGGYMVGILGFSMLKSAYGLSATLSPSDLALPSHRGKYLAAAQTWFNQLDTGAGGAVGQSNASGATGSSGAPATQGQGSAAAKGGTVITPTTPGGLTGVDLNGNHYARKCPTCPWVLVSGPTGNPIVAT